MVTTHPQRIIDAHCHIGEIPPWKFYDLEHPVKPTVYDYRSTAEFVKNHMDEFKIERALTMSNYGVPVHEISFDLNDVVMDAATTNDRILAAIWVSFLPRNAEMTRKALKLAAESRVVALKTTFLLGGNPDPGTWDDETRAIADECFDACEKHDLIFHFHTSPGATRTSRTSSRSSSATASAARSTSCTSAAGCRVTSAWCRSSCSGCRTATRCTRTPPGRSVSARAGC